MFTLEDVMARKHWLQASVVMLLIFPIFLLVSGLMTAPALRAVWGVVVGGWISFLIGYCCAYRKCGTKYLTFVLITGPFSMFKHVVDELLAFPTIGGLLFLGFKLSLYIWWYKSTLRLRSLNKKIQYEEMRQIEESVF